jgi:hypothetical protein
MSKLKYHLLSAALLHDDDGITSRRIQSPHPGMKTNSNFEIQLNDSISKSTWKMVNMTTFQQWPFKPTVGQK